MGKLEIKSWDEYSESEKETLLLHWFHYYGKIPYSLAHLDKFKELIKANSRKVFEVAVADFFVGGPGPALFVHVISEGKERELFSTLPNILEQGRQFLNEYKRSEAQFINMLVDSYNNPLPPVPLSSEQIIQGIIRVYSRNDKGRK